MVVGQNRGWHEVGTRRCIEQRVASRVHVPGTRSRDAGTIMMRGARVGCGSSGSRLVYRRGEALVLALCMHAACSHAPYSHSTRQSVHCTQRPLAGGIGSH